jgi:hypothetical protein
MTTVPVPSAATRPASSAFWRPTLLAAVAAVVVNVVIFLVGQAAGATFEIPDPNAADMTIGLTVVTIIGFTAVPLLVGAVAAVLLVPRWPGARLGLQILGAALTLISLVPPLALDTDTGTRVLLAVMHVVAGVAYVWGLAAAPRGA